MNKSVPKIKLCDFNVDCFTNISAASEYIMENCLNKPTIAIAINPEKVLQCIDDIEVAKIIHSADIRYLDGIGAVKVAERKLRKKLSRIPGCDLWAELMRISADNDTRVFLLGASSIVINATKKGLRESGVNVVGAIDGYFDDTEDVIERIISSKPNILAVAMGSPKQEKFMFQCKEKGLNCFMMGVGGSFDVYSGKVKRAPVIWCKLNLEWLYRLLMQPSRIFRQLRLFRFLRLALFNRI